MQTKGNGKKSDCKGDRFCNPKNFQKMFEKGGPCFAGMVNGMDCAKMSNDMMKKMMEMCYPQYADDLKESADHQNEHEA